MPTRVVQRLLPRLLAAGVWLGALALARPALADTPPPVDAGATHTLIGNTGGALATYSFTVPPNTAAPVVSVTFNPTDVADGKRAGFQVLLDGTVVGNGSTTATPGLLQYTMPQNPAGTAVVQVFAYDGSTPVGFTISAAAAAPINGQLSETLPANAGGSFAYFTFPSPGATPPTTVSLSYSPADARVNQAVGFNVFDAFSNNIGSAIQPAGQNFTAATLTVDLSRPVGESLTVQVFDYAPDVQITYRVSVSGIPPLPSTSAPAAPPATASVGFQPFWVENFVPTPLWSGPDAHAVSFGIQPQFSSFLVVKRQTSSRLYVYNPRTRDYAFIDASAVGPTGPPPGQ